MPFTRARNQGMTLLELLLYASVMGILAVSTMQVLGDSRTVRGNARDRAAMTLIAQGELEKIRALPPAKLAQRNETITSEEWPRGVSAVIDVQPYEHGLWQVDVRVRRESPEGKSGARLTTIIPGARP